MSYQHSFITQQLQFKEFFRIHDFDIITVSETWLNLNISDAQFSLPSFKLYRNDRTNKRGGGVAIYVKCCLPSSYVLSSIYTENKTEYLLVEIWHSTRHKLLVSAVYNPPLSDCLDHLEIDLDEIMPHYKHVMILGDFNIDMNIANNESDYLLEFGCCLGLQLINYNPTYHTFASHTWIDHCLVNNLDFVLSSKQSSEPFLADHDMISIQYNYNVPNNNKRKL